MPNIYAFMASDVSRRLIYNKTNLLAIRIVTQIHVTLSIYTYTTYIAKNYLYI